MPPVMACFTRIKRIAVICNDKKYEHEVKYLADLAAEVLYFPAYNDSEIELQNVKISKDAPIALIGDSLWKELRFEAERLRA